jgi:hypothetical protein
MKNLLFIPLLLISCLCFAQDAKEIIGKPIKIGNLLVAENDFPIGLMWDDANKACRSLGKGWRLPTKAELNTLYQNKNKIGGFSDFTYWSFSKNDSNFARGQNFSSGIHHYGYYENVTFYVRAVSLPGEVHYEALTSVPVQDAKEIIGKPIKVGNLLVAQNDIPGVMMWDDANKACRALGKDWRLPTKAELYTLFQNKNKIGGFAKVYYWTSSEFNNYDASVQALASGIQVYASKTNTYHVRAVSLPGEVQYEALTIVPVQDGEEIIGNPIRIGNLLVAQHDFPVRIELVDAKAACAKLGKGWRLPTKNELNILYKNREKIGGFRDDIYWSSTEYDNSNLWFQRFYGGGSQDYGNKFGPGYVRAIRTF